MQVLDLMYDNPTKNISPEDFDWVKIGNRYEYTLNDQLEAYEGTRKTRVEVVVKSTKNWENNRVWSWSVHIRKYGRNYDLSGWDKELDRAKILAIKNARDLSIYVLLDKGK